MMNRRLKRKIAQQQLSVLGRGSHVSMRHTKRKPSVP